MTAPTTDHLINNNNAIVTTVLTNASPVVLYAADASYSAQNNRVKILQGEGSLTASVTAESADSIGISAVDIHASSLAYGDVDIVVSGDGGNTWGNAYAATAIPVPTSDYVTGAGVITDNTSLFWAIPGAADGWQIEYPGTLSDGSTLTVSADGTFVRADPVDPSITFALWVYDPAANVWDTQQVTIRDGEVIQQPVFTGPIPDQSDPEDTLIQALDLSAYFSGGALHYTAVGLPAGLSLDADSGVITGTVGAPTAASVTVTATNTIGSVDAAPFAITITDATAPQVTPPPAATLLFAYGAGGLALGAPSVIDWLGQASATDETSPANPALSNDLATRGDPVGPGTYPVVFTAADDAGNSASATATLTVAEGPDRVPPDLLDGPTVGAVGAEAFELLFVPSEGGSCRLVVLPGGSAPPGVGQVLAGQDANGAGPSFDSGLLDMTGGAQSTLRASGFSGGTVDAYLGVIDDAGNAALFPVAGISLLGDASAPLIIDGPDITAGETSLSVIFSPNESGQWRLLALPDGASVPTAAEVLDAGTGSAGVAALADSELQLLAAGQPSRWALAELDPDTTVALALGLRDGAGNAAVVMLSGKTLARAVTPQLLVAVARIDDGTVQLSAVPNVSIAALQFRLDGTSIGPAIIVAPYEYDWPVTGLAAGTYQVTALASLGTGAVVESAPAVLYVSQPELSLDDVFFADDTGTPKATAPAAFTSLVAGFGIPTDEPGMRAQWDAEVARQGVAINNDSAYSPFWRLVTAIVTRPALWLVQLVINEVLPNYFVKYAGGDYLDIAANGVMLARKAQSRAVGTVRFSRHDASQELTIPVGTVIETVPINDHIYRVATTAGSTFAERATTLDVPVAAESAGSAYNLAAGYYSILDQPIAGVLATNLTGWLTVPGADIESDDELRQRIRNQFGTVSSYHTDAVYRGIIAERQGIAIDRIYIEHDAPRGPGTANAFILFDVGDNPQPYIDALNRHITDDEEHGLGDDFLVLAMPETSHDLAVTVYAYHSLSAAQKTTLRDEVEQFVRCAFRENLGYNSVTKVLPESRFSFSRLGEELHQQFPGAESVDFDSADIVSAIEVPRLGTLTVTVP